MLYMEIGEAQLQELQAAARELGDKLSSERPIFVEFAGTPKSGKSTCIDTVNHFFRRLDYKVLAPTEGASKRTPYYLKDDFVAFNTWSAAYALTHILEGRFGSDQYQLVIMDRGLFDALAWFELLRAKGDVTEEDCTVIQSFLLVGHWRQLVDAVFLFKTDPATSLVRENSNKLIEEPGRAMNPEFLRDLNDAYQSISSKYSEQFRSVYEVDTGGAQDTTPQSTAFEVVKRIIDHIRSRVA